MYGVGIVGKGRSRLTTDDKERREAESRHGYCGLRGAGTRNI